MQNFDVFIQKAAVWDNAPSSRIMVSLLLPGPMEADQWLHTVRANRHMWPLQMTSHAAANQLATDIFMRRERRRLQARHIWEKIQPNWPLIEERVWTKHATGLPYQALYRRLFLQEYTEESRWLENSYKGPNAHWIWDQMDVLSWQWIDCHERIVVQVWHTKQGVFRRKLPA